MFFCVGTPPEQKDGKLTAFGQKIRSLRAKKGVNQVQMAEELGVSAAYLSALEHGKKGAPSWAMTQKIIQYFGLIWDEAEDLLSLAQLSRRRVSLDTTGLDPRATRAANLLARRIGHLSPDELDALLLILDTDREPET